MKQDVSFAEVFDGYQKLFRKNMRSVRHAYSVDVGDNLIADWARFLVVRDWICRKAVEKQ